MMALPLQATTVSGDYRISIHSDYKLSVLLDFINRLTFTWKRTSENLMTPDLNIVDLNLSQRPQDDSKV